MGKKSWDGNTRSLNKIENTLKKGAPHLIERWKQKKKKTQK